MNPIFTKMVDAVEAANAAPDDYINSADGLKYCGKCRTPKEAFYPADLQACLLYTSRGSHKRKRAAELLLLPESALLLIGGRFYRPPASDGYMVI